MNILIIGDVFGSPGRLAIKKLLPKLQRETEAEFTIVNCENAAHGKGITEATGVELFEAGADALTGGNHIFHQRGSDEYLDSEPRIIRPLNFPPGAPGRGSGVFTSASGVPVAVVNACGRVFMEHFDDPFRALDREVSELARETPIIIVDFHAEATSEKVAMGWFLDGRATAVVGTHTHIPTADETLLDNGTAYVTDLGMTGPYDSVIGVKKEIILEKMLTMRQARFDVAEARRVRLHGVLVRVDPSTGRALHIERVRREL
ncbi:MAG: TIGR00282 family metallophosphoesterase [Candidatus Sumerlaeia bacterium]|nr:TIGR00282 family metallophosphoesterase [Candidatus Sumerlaeia bacterium]